MKKLFGIAFLLLIIIPITSAIPIIKLNKTMIDKSEKKYSLPIIQVKNGTAVLARANSSDYWDDLDTPNDFTQIKIGDTAAGDDKYIDVTGTMFRWNDEGLDYIRCDSGGSGLSQFNITCRTGGNPNWWRFLLDLYVDGDIDSTGDYTGNIYYGEVYNKSYAGYDIDLTATDDYKNITGLVAGNMNMMNNVSDVGISPQVSGTYSIYYKVDFEGNGEYGMNIAVNGVTYDTCYSLGSTNVGAHQHFQNNCILSLTAGDAVTIMIDDHDNPVNDPTIHNTKIKLEWLGK